MVGIAPGGRWIPEEDVDRDGEEWWDGGSEEASRMKVGIYVVYIYV